MKVIKKDKEDNKFICTLTELTTITNPNYLFTFIHDQQRKKINKILIDTSLHPERYNLFIIDEPIDIDFEFSGDYTYEVREQVSAINTDPTLSGAVVERGRAIVIGSAMIKNEFESVDTENYIFKE